MPPINLNFIVDEEHPHAPGGSAQSREAAIDLTAYPILTEEVGYPPSPLAAPSGGAQAGTMGSPLGQMAARAVADVLGWKPKAGDSKGFLGALTQSFSLTEVEGRTESKWTPRTYAVQSDLSGGISGAQASVFARANEAVNQSMPLLDGLYSLDTEADAQDVTALKAIIRSQLSELVSELGLPGGPRVTRVNQIFLLVLGTTPFARIIPPQLPLPPNTTETEPDNVGGLLGQIRDEMGLWSVVVANPAIQRTVLTNTVDQEQDVTNYRILVDYITSLQQSWQNSQQFFGLQTTTPFFGTQLVILSRQLSVVADAVDEVRFTMDSVFITPSERQTLMLIFQPMVTLPNRPNRPANISEIKTNSQPMFVEDLLSWIQRFATEEGPRLIQDGGKFGVGNSVRPVVVLLRNLVLGAINPANIGGLPRGYRTPRVQRALQDLSRQLDELAFLSSPISYTMPPQE
jgi:hypothetical protein